MKKDEIKRSPGSHPRSDREGGHRRDAGGEKAASAGNKPARPVDRASEKRADARKLALLALSDVTIGGGYSNIVLDKRLREFTLTPEDRALATSLLYTALEHRMYIDYLLAQFIDHMPEEKIVREILHLAVTQIIYMDRVPDYAAVNCAVSQIKGYNRPQYAPMINGALRNLIRARDAGELREPDRAGNPVRYLSIMHSVPETMIKRLVDTYGEDETEAIVSFVPPEHWETVRPNLNEISDDAFLDLLYRKDYHFVRGGVAHSVRLIGAGDLTATDEYRSGLFSIQSESSMLAAMAVGAKPGQQILDACAAPGGKTALMAEQMRGSGRVYACDIHSHRVALIRRTAERLRLYNVRPMECDATVPRPDFDRRMDGVLLDAPCTGLGVIFGKPDLKYRLKDEKIEQLTAVQASLLDTCSA